jgi:hypothetical protein
MAVGMPVSRRLCYAKTESSSRMPENVSDDLKLSSNGKLKI